MSFKWPHFENIHRYVANYHDPDSLFTEEVCITEKMDGSNLSIHVEKIGEEWVVKQLIGRNCPIWNQKMKNTYENLSYGSVGNMGKLVFAMKDFAVKLAEKVNTKIILISGEVFRANGKFATWHPFGYTTEIIKKDTVKEPKETKETNDTVKTEEKVGTEGKEGKEETEETDEQSDEKEAIKINFLTSKIHKLFVECSENVTQDQLKEKLAKATSNLIFPPPLLFVGKLSQGINELYVLMQKLSKEFEGSFIIFENISWGFKWKTGFHDEQMQVTQAENIIFKSEEALQAYTKLIEIFNNKPKKELKAEKPQKEEKPSEGKILSSDVITAFRRELSKTEPICRTPKDKRDDLIKSFTRLVIDEITIKYKESNLPFPYSEELLEKQTGLIVGSLINKEPYKK